VSGKPGAFSDLPPTFATINVATYFDPKPERLGFYFWSKNDTEVRLDKISTAGLTTEQVAATRTQRRLARLWKAMGRYWKCWECQRPVFPNVDESWPRVCKCGQKFYPVKDYWAIRKQVLDMIDGKGADVESVKP
jgi:hypothetical protein